MGIIMVRGQFVATSTPRRWAYGHLLLWFLSCTMPVSLPDAWGQPPVVFQPKEAKVVQPVRVAQRADVEANTPSVSLENNRLNIDVQNYNVQDLLRDLVARGDIEVRHLDSIPSKNVSLRLANVPVVDGLKRLFRLADINSYVLITQEQGEAIRVQRILFFPANDIAPQASVRSPGLSRPAPPASVPTAQSESDRGGGQDSDSVFQDLKTNTAARRLLSQLVHPNEQVRERALERLVRLVDNDDKQAELLEFLEPLMENMSSEDQIEREEARQEIRKLLRR
jgi:hypothetical protein